MITKSITLPYLRLITTFFCALILTISIQHVSSQSDKKYKVLEILDDLPLKEDLERYLTCLESIVHFVDSKRLYADLNLAFGLFLVDVNLKTIFKMKSDKLPVEIKTRLHKIIVMNEDLLKYFRQMLDRYIEESNTDTPVRYIAELISNDETIWSNHLQKFKTELLKTTKFLSKRELKDIYSKWRDYKEKVYDFDSYNPDPGISDSCISALSRTPANNEMEWIKCNLSVPCTEIVLNGTDYGYGITHRLMYLIMARFARGCTIISGQEDKSYVDKFCSKIYNEAEYLSQNKFDIPDLSMEQISLCSLEGHAQFLRRSWLDDLLEFQTDNGCFATSLEDKEVEPPMNIYETERPKWALIHDDQDILGGMCNSHTTGVASGMLSAAIRYVIEKHF